MFIILLQFSDNKVQAAHYMQGHKEWLQNGFDEGTFLLSGSIKPSTGGSILATNTTYPELVTRVNKDPFVIENVVRAEVMEIEVSKTNESLAFLLNTSDNR